MAYQSYPRHEPRHFVPPDFGYYPATPPPPRLPPLGSLAERTNPGYMLATASASASASALDNGYLNRSATQTLPLRMHHHGPPIDPRAYAAPAPVAYEERSSPMMSQGREPQAHRVRTYDQESQ
ncbi:hypothetical protein N7532_008987 [Penicillium argentinense]|uniref:Uncharacterized protein n=1 Tax=Penicillium argentinense TaxID=1131581 RepID=A0A9W9EYF6_9EURO|nr:uncharacterized protein N7532_008987 [Penicillium argentinense]KAJ5090303.1 hypothetical protein N7532_008987 [Penicillium argentinense]